MKKIFLILGAVFLLLAVGTGILLVSFDADRLRPALLKKLEEATGIQPIRLSRLSLTLRGGFAISLKGLSVEPSLQVEEASAGVKLLPLLKGNIQIGHVVVLRPKVSLVRKPDGSIGLEGIDLTPRRPAPKASSSAPPAGAALALAISSVQVKEGTVDFKDSSSRPPLRLSLQPLDLWLKDVSFSQPTSFKAKAEGVLLPAEGSGEPHLTGKISFSSEGTLELKEPEKIPQTVKATADIRLTDAAIKNLNILREVFSRLSMLPGLAESLESRLPEEYRAKLTERDTSLEPVNLSVTIGQGALSFNDLRLATDSFELAGGGKVTLEGSLSSRMTLRVEPKLSFALFGSVEELKALSDEEGRLTLPVILQGTLPKVLVLPDLSYVASRLMPAKAEKLIGGLLENLLEKGK
ncbi:MAG: AsmA family protein [Candidatus Omnitrophica bacterium]|nr:AsmA family protein [Candidatus Omnitrophota bacterium]